MDDRLYRSVDDRMLAGVAGGVAERLDADPSIVRVVWALLVVLTGGIALLAYVIMAVVVPEGPGGADEAPLWQPAPGTGPVPDAPPAGNVTPDPDAPTAATAFATTGLAAATADTPSTTAGGGAALVAPATPPGGAPTSPGGWVAPDGRTVARAAGPARSRRQRSGSGQGDDRGALIGGLVLILIGGFFLLRQFIPAIDLGSWWPLILVGIGVILVIISVRPDRTSD